MAAPALLRAVQLPAKFVRGSGGRIVHLPESSPLRRPFSTSPVSAESSSIEATKGSLQETAAGIVRNGPGDCVITLNVGGKEFMTLRSTVASNAVLANTVARAEANQGLTCKGDAVFIDRDPQFFHIILTHLRNKVEGISYGSKKAQYMKKTAKYVQLPKDSSQLRDIYVEATHFEIDELQHALCEQSFIVNVFGTLAGSGNPFDAASNFLKNLRRGAVAFAGVSSVVLAETKPDWLIGLIGIARKGEADFSG